MDKEEIKKLDKMHIMHSWSVNEGLDPKVITGAEGVYMIDADGKKIMDFSSQLKCVNTGHNVPRIVKAIQEQAEKLCYIGPGFAYEARSKLGQALAGVTPGDLNKFFFTLGGAEANENALKMARAYTKKHKILSYYISYHGATQGAITLTGDPRRPPLEPGIPGVVHILNPYCYRCPFKLTYPSCDLHCADYLEEMIRYEDADTVAGIIMETVIGGSGVIIPPDGYLQRLRKICDANNMVFIADEVMAGFGRTGKWFAVEHWNVVPDLMTMAKGLTSSHIPMGAVAISDTVADALSKEMLYCGLTYSGHPVSSAAALATIATYKEDKLIENARVLGEIQKAEFEKMKDKHPCVGDARSIGLFGCIELVKNKKTKERLVPYNAMGKAAAITKEINKRMMERGVYAPARWWLMFSAPPLCITEDQLREGLTVTDEVLDWVDTLTEN